MDNQEIITPTPPATTSRLRILLITLGGALLFLLWLSLGYFVVLPKEKASVAVTPTSPALPSPEALTVSCVGRYTCTATHKESKTGEIRQRTIDLSELGWDVGLMKHFGDEKNLMSLDTASDQILIPLTVAPGGIGGSKPEGTLPDPPFKTALYTTTFLPHAPLTQIYATNTFAADTTLFDPKTRTLYLTQVLPTTTTSKETIWSYDLEIKTLEKFVDVSFPPLSQYGSVFKELQLSEDTIIQRVDPNGGMTSTPAKLIKIKIDSKKMTIEDTPWQ